MIENTLAIKLKCNFGSPLNITVHLVEKCNWGFIEQIFRGSFLLNNISLFQITINLAEKCMYSTSSDNNKYLKKNEPFQFNAK